MSVRRMSIAFSLAVSFLLVADQGYAQLRGTGFEVSPFGGVQFNSKATLGLDDELVGGWRLAYFFHRYVGVETQFSYSQASAERPNIDARILHSDWNVVARLPALFTLDVRKLGLRRGHLYATAGLGMFFLDPDLRGDRRHFASLSFNAGVGFKAFFSKWWALRGEFRGYLFESLVDLEDPLAQPTTSSGQLSLGILYLLR